MVLEDYEPFSHSVSKTNERFLTPSTNQLLDSRSEEKMIGDNLVNITQQSHPL